MKFLIYLVVIFFVFLNCITANKVADSLLQDSCKKASKYKENEQNFYKFCITSIKENPESQKVRNIDELTMVGTKNALSNLTNVKGMVEKILKERKYKTKLSEKLLRECLKLYSEATGWLTKALDDIKLRDYRKVFDSTSDARAVSRECEMKFNDDNQQKNPVLKENDVLFEMIDIPLSFNYEAHIYNKTS